MEMILNHSIMHLKHLFSLLYVYVLNDYDQPYLLMNKIKFMMIFMYVNQDMLYDIDFYYDYVRI